MKRLSFVNFPIPFDHPYTLPSLLVAVTASSLVYYYLQNSHTADLIEAVRLRDIRKRRALKRPEDKFASLQVERWFVNPFEEWREVQWWETALFWLTRWKGNSVPTSEAELDRTLPVMKPDLDKFRNKPSELSESWVQVNGITFAWLGQSTCLVRMDGLTILTDPIFTKRTINDYIGPKRLRPMPCSLEDIKDSIDIVIISHDHFDHLDERVVHTLNNSVTWYVPLGLRSWFVKKGVENVIELDWWQEIHHAGHTALKVSCVPAMHWSGSRTLFDKNTTLWCSYVLKTSSNRIFFCGDTGYSPELFKAIGDQHGPFALAILPIGSFKPEFLMQHLHMGPLDAVKVHHDLGCPRLSIGIHWGTFMMSDEHYLEPVQILKEAWRTVALERGVEELLVPSTSSSRFITTALGETITVE